MLEIQQNFDRASPKILGSNWASEFGQGLELQNMDCAVANRIIGVSARLGWWWRVRGLGELLVGGRLEVRSWPGDCLLWVAGGAEPDGRGVGFWMLWKGLLVQQKSSSHSRLYSCGDLEKGAAAL